MNKKHGIRHYRLILVCLMLSALAWFAVKMSKNYTQIYALEIEFVNLPNGKMVSYQSDSVMTVEVSSKGMFLMSLDLKTKHILIDYKAVTTPTQRQSSYVSIQTKRLKDYLIENRNFPQNTVVIEPKRVSLEMRNGK